MYNDEKFNEYVELFKKLPLNDKKKRTHEEIKKLLGFIEKAKQDLNINSEILYNKEISDLNGEDISDDDFVEAVFVYTHMIQESLGEYFNTVAPYLYK